MNIPSDDKLFSHWKQDFPAGLVVFLVALPLCLGIALASTNNPDLLFSGIIAGVVGGIVVGFLSGSALGVSGPAAGLVVIVLTAIQTLGSFEAFLTAVVLAGALQFLAGFVRAGIIAYFFPSSVIKGMLTAIGIILILKEIPHALGYDEDFIGDFYLNQKDGKNTFTELYYAIRFNSTGAIIISCVSLAILILFDQKFIKKIKLFTYLPGALFVVITGILMNELFKSYFPDLALSGKHLVGLPVASSISEFAGFFTLPDFSALGKTDVYIVALTLAVVASLESLLSVEATDKLDPYRRRTSADRELKAQGLGNMVSGLLGGLPITQVIVRSSANIDSGGKTKLGAIAHGVILLIAVVFLPRVLNLIPLASLAAVLLMVGYKLAKPRLFVDMFKLSKLQFIAFLVTIIAIVSTDLLKGIGVGMCVFLFYVLRRNYMNPSKLIKEIKDGKEVYTLILSEETTFLNKASIAKTLDEIPENSKLIIDNERSFFIAYDVLDNIQDYIKHTAKYKKIEVIAKGLREVTPSAAH